MLYLRRAIIVGLLFAVPLAGQAQTSHDLDTDNQRQGARAPYDPALMRLSEILGSIHYLRALCGADEGLIWRDSMNELIAAEEPGPNRKAQLVSRFNHGYKTFSSIYRTCTPSALMAADRYVREGVRLSSQITTQFGR